MNLHEHLKLEVTTTATCWKLHLKNGNVLGFTDLDEDLIIDSVRYLANSGAGASAVSKENNLAEDNYEVKSIIDNELISKDDILRGDYDDAEVTMFLVNYEDPNQGLLIISRGYIGNINVKDNSFLAEIKPISSKLNAPLTRIYSPNCDAEFGDSRCGMNLATYDKASNGCNKTMEDCVKHRNILNFRGFLFGQCAI